MSENSRDVIFSEKKKPAGMPTHRTGVGVRRVLGYWGIGGGIGVGGSLGGKKY